MTPLQLSGWGFSTGAAPAPVVEVVKALTAEEIINGVSRTDQAQWEELGRFPPVLDAVDHCQICGQVEGAEDPLECEMVRCLNLLSPPLRILMRCRRDAVRAGFPRRVPIASHRRTPGRCVAILIDLHGKLMLNRL